MKNKILKISIVAALFGFQACNYNDLDPTDFVGGGDVFSSAQSVKEVTIGAYAQLKLKESMHVSEIISDNVYQGGQYGGLGADAYKWSYTASVGDQAEIWSRNYALINEVNRIIINAPGVKTHNDAEKVSLDNSIGAAYFMRAYAHFELLAFFSDCTKEDGYGIPYIKKPHTLDLPGRNTVKDCFDWVLEDLNMAMSLLEEDAPSDPAFASKAAIYAMRARVYEYRSKWSDAYNAAKEALALVPMTTIDNYPNIWKDKSNDGVIFELRRNAGDTKIGSMFYQDDNSVAYGPSDSYRACLDANDVRQMFMTQAPDRDGIQSWVVNKYPGEEGARGRNDEKIFRSAEMKLIQIEALIQQDLLPEASTELNNFRKLRIPDYTTVNYSSKSELVDELLLERRRELAFEGHRFFDLKRYKRDIVRNVSSTMKGDSYKMLMPIPHAEIVVNATIAKQQNPGY